MSSVAQYVEQHEAKKHNIELPVFDYKTYNIILSRIGRQKKLLTEKELGTNSFNRLKGSLDRSEKLKTTFINRYLTDLAIFVVFHNHEVSLIYLLKNELIDNDRMPIILRDHWSDFISKVRKAKKLYP